MNPFRFFLAHAGYSYDPKTETEEQGKRRCARALAESERKARDGGFSYQWSQDPDIDSSDHRGRHADDCPWPGEQCTCTQDTDPYALWQCAMYNSRGQIVASLHGIDFGRDGTPWSDPYKRVVEAELAVEGLTNEPQGKVRA